MSDPRYTPEGLPILTEDTVQMHFIEEGRLDSGSESDLITVMENRAQEIFGANKVLERALSRFCRKYGFSGDEELYVKAAGIYVYQLLKRQAEINSLEKRSSD